MPRTLIGPATLYRHFPTKQLLATEAFTEQLHARHRGFAAAFRSAFPDALDVTAGRDYALNTVATLAFQA